ncbi:MAG: alkaline phosphatase [Lautropia sp.]|nr:alkaline phosphatase [Lautropia sp.]
MAVLLAACSVMERRPPSSSHDVSRADASPRVAGQAPASASSPARRARHVILMINDGAGWGTWDAAAYWQHGGRHRLPYAGFAEQYGMTTYPLNTEDEPTHDAVMRGGYDPARAWDARPTGEPTLPFEGYQYLSTQPTDSAAAGTALASGHKTYNQAINHDNFGKPLDFITLTAREQGKATGIVTSVPFSHATPAAFGAQNRSRKSYHEIADQMLSQGHLDLIFGMGAPGFNQNGTPCERLAEGESREGCASSAHEFLSRQSWARLSSGQWRPAGASGPWQVIRRKADFEALARGERRVEGPLFGSPEVSGSGTLQQQRELKILGRDDGNPSGIAYIPGVPSLATMTEAALKHLARDRDGFFMMVEGGATDWAAHTSECTDRWSYSECQEGRPEYGRLIEETVAFNEAVRTVVDWVEENSSWDETLLIVTSDHDNSVPLGSQGNRQAFQPVENRGKGVMPGISFRKTGDHSNALVPLWAHGAGAEAFRLRIRGQDQGLARHVSLIRNEGRYVDNTDVYQVMRAALTGVPVQPVR